MTPNPECAGDLTPQIVFGLELAEQMYNLKRRVTIEAMRTHMNETMAELFEQVDFVMAPDHPSMLRSARRDRSPPRSTAWRPAPGTTAPATIPSNIYGNPAISVPAGTVRGMPVGLQVLAPHHREPMLLDLTLVAEPRAAEGALVAPGAPV